MPEGLNSPAGEGGSSLSGGQKQRIAIARGLIKNAPIVCMDEPTAALDSKSENTIRDSISRLIAGKTVLMVTHRKALLSLMDIIYVVDGGTLHNISEYGGLDVYLQKISDTEADERQKKIDDQEQQRAQQQVAQLQAENQGLQERLNSLGQRQEQPGANAGTIYINH